MPSPRDPLYPIGKNRDERILIEYDGILHSEAEEIFYGLKNAGCLHVYPFKKYHALIKQYDAMRLQNTVEAKHYIYKEISFFQPHDLLLYLNDGIEMTPEREDFALKQCRENYRYNPITLTSFAGALIPLVQEDIIKGVTIVFPKMWNFKMVMYLDKLYTHDTMKEKMLIAMPDQGENITDTLYNLMNTANDDNNPYTTIITNEYEFIKKCLEDYTNFGDQGQLYLLRNHSGNTDMVMQDGKYKFIERGNDELESLIMPQKDRIIDGLPLPLMVQFGRFVSMPYQH